MIIENKLELLILKEILSDYYSDINYRNFIEDNYNIEKLEERYLKLGKEFLKPYALDKTKKLD